MRTYLESKELNNLKAVIGTVTGKDIVVSFKFGTRVVEDRMSNICMVLAGTEQLVMQFTSMKPDDFDGTPVIVNFKQKELLSVLNSLSAMNEKIYFESTAAGCDIGIEDSANIKVPTVGNDSLPPVISPVKEKTQIQFTASSNQLSEALIAGMSMTGSMDGMDNVALIFDKMDATEEKVNSTIKVMSTDSFRIIRGQAPITVANSDISTENRKEVLKNGQITVPVGQATVANLAKLLTMCKDCKILITDKHVTVAIGASIMYTFVRASKVLSINDKVDGWVAADKCIRIVVDANELKQKVDLLNTASELSEVKKPIRFFIEEGKKVRIGIDASDTAMVEFKPVDSVVKQNLEINLNSKLLTNALNNLKKGNISISFMAHKKIRNMPVMFTNGDLEKTVDNATVIFLMPVADSEASQPKDDTAAGSETEGVMEEE